jgi:hypothetical protein
MSSPPRAWADVATIAILQHRAVIQAHVVGEQPQRAHALNSRILIEQPKAWSPSASTSAWTTPSRGCEITPAATTRSSSTLPFRYRRNRRTRDPEQEPPLL